VRRRARLGPGSREKRRERFRRQYGSVENVEAIKREPCWNCGVRGYTVAAHTETGGTGMKAGPETLAALCCSRMDVKGCHEKLDDYELEDERPRLQAKARARWQERTEQEEG
jgi:hypothetical protein